MQIKQLQIQDIQPTMLSNFDRYQEVTQRWLKQENGWILEDVSYVRQWDDEGKQWAVGVFKQCLEQGGIVIGAFEGDALIGFAEVGAELCGSLKQYANLSLLIVSNGYRNKGIGTALFEATCEKARNLNIPKLYISAHASTDSIAFYKKMGCKDAEELIESFIDTPFDWQMEYEFINLK